MMHRNGPIRLFKCKQAMTRFLDGAPNEMHAYLLGDFQSQSGLNEKARACQVDRGEYDVAETCDVKRRSMVQRTGASGLHLSIVDRGHQFGVMFSMPCQNTILRGIDVGFSDLGTHV